MRVYVIVVDQIFEVEGKQVDEEIHVYRCPSGSGLSGSILSKFAWASTKDYAYWLLELSIKRSIDQWKTFAQFYEKEHRAFDLQTANENIKTFEELLPKVRLFDPMFIKYM
jgi:hypothetical protein